MRIENWGVCSNPVSPYQAPELFKYSISGHVYDHPHFPDGEFILTSYIVEVDPINKSVKTYSGSIYELGEPAKEYEELYPGAKERFFNASN